jgi:hypothetical protein
MQVSSHHSVLAIALLVVSTTAASTPSMVKLNNGVEMPIVIYGAGGAYTQDNVTGTVVQLKMALSPEVGFAGVDTANHCARSLAHARKQ